MEIVTLLGMYAFALWILLPCVIGALAYYFVVKAAVGIHWLVMGEDRRDIERRRKQIRVRD